MSDVILGGLNDLTQDPIWDTDCFKQFVDLLADDITGACMIPMNLPKKEIQNIIERAKKWFYKKYEYSVRETFIGIPFEAFNSDYFKRTRSLTLPNVNPLTGGGEIYSVWSVFETRSNFGGGGSSVSYVGGDFDMNRMLMNQLTSSGSGVVSAAENLQYYVINQSFFDLSSEVLNNPISFHYSQLTHQIRFTGQAPITNVVLSCYETIPECALFQDEIFFRYCSAKIKISLGSKMSIFSMPLPGNVEFNADAITNLGESELEGIIEEIKEDEGTDWFFTSGTSK